MTMMGLMPCFTRYLLLLLMLLPPATSAAFQVQSDLITRCRSATTLRSAASSVTTASTQEKGKDDDELAVAKKQLMGLLKQQPVSDTILVDPMTKSSLQITSRGTLLGGDPTASRLSYKLQSSNNTYAGTSDSYLNLLEPTTYDDVDDNQSSIFNRQQFRQTLARNFGAFIPPPLRSRLVPNVDYIPMRDLFTSPQVSFAYERGWRQGFARAGFPGPDKEARMAMDYFAPVVARQRSSGGSTTVVDMSCATGLFTRRFAKSNQYDRVLGCDYSPSMLDEARRRIRADAGLRGMRTRLDLVRLDVGQIPMKDNSIVALHAGAAMHCWPDLPRAVSEIHRVLQPGGRYFATTFLSKWFGQLRAFDGGNQVPKSRRAFQYFESVEQLRALMQGAGFASDKIFIEVLGDACVVIRAEK